MLKSGDELPAAMRTDAVREYYDVLAKKRGSLLCKRLLDVVISACC